MVRKQIWPSDFCCRAVAASRTSTIRNAETPRRSDKAALQQPSQISTLARLPNLWSLPATFSIPTLVLWVPPTRLFPRADACANSRLQKDRSISERLPRLAPVENDQGRHERRLP